MSAVAERTELPSIANQEDAVQEGFKRTEVGIIPGEWEIHRVDDLFVFLRTSNKSRADLDETSETAYVHYGDIHTRWSFRIDFQEASPPRIAHAKVGTAALLRDGDLIVADASEDEIGVGKSVEVANLKEKTAIAGLHTLLLRSRDNRLANGFKGYIQEMPCIKSQLRRIATGTKVYGLSKSGLREVILPVPPMDQQRAIAKALSDVDGLIRALDRLIAKKRDIKQAAMQQLLTGKLRLPGFSGDWKLYRYGDVFDFLRTANNPRSDFSADGTIGYIHYGDIHASNASFLNFESTRVPMIRHKLVAGVPLLENGDLVMADASEDYDGIGKCVEILHIQGQRAVAGLHTILLRGDRELLSDGFKAYLQFVPEVRTALIRLATGISVYGVSKNSIRSIEVRLPSRAEQSAIATVLSDMEAEIAALERRRDKTKAIKQGMMQALLTGRVRLVTPEVAR